MAGNASRALATFAVVAALALGLQLDAETGVLRAELGIG